MAFLFFANYFLFAQKIISEGSICYNIQISNDGKTTTDSATCTIYLKGNTSRMDIANSLGNETTIYDAKAGNSVILKQYSGQKLMITLTKQNWLDKYDKYDGIIFNSTNEAKQIAGYNCKKAVAQLKNGSDFFVYYTTEVNTFNKEYDPIFRNLPGLPIFYEFSNGKLTFKYTLSFIDVNPLPSVKFDIPKSGYRIMTYSESQQKKN